MTQWKGLMLHSYNALLLSLYAFARLLQEIFLQENIKESMKELADRDNNLYLIEVRKK